MLVEPFGEDQAIEGDQKKKRGVLTGGKMKPRRHINGRDQTTKLIDNCYKTVLESRTDWLAYQLVLIYHETTGEDGKNGLTPVKYVKLATDIKEYLTKSTEKMSDLAYAEGNLPVSEVADEICNFYNILPHDIFMRKPSTFVPEEDAEYGDEFDYTPVPKKEKQAKKPKKEPVTEEVDDPTPVPKKKRGRPSNQDASSVPKRQYKKATEKQGKRSKSTRPA